MLFSGLQNFRLFYAYLVFNQGNQGNEIYGNQQPNISPRHPTSASMPSTSLYSTANELRQNASYNESQGPPNQPKDAATFRLKKTPGLTVSLLNCKEN